MTKEQRIRVCDNLLRLIYSTKSESAYYRYWWQYDQTRRRLGE